MDSGSADSRKDVHEQSSGTSASPRNRGSGGSLTRPKLLQLLITQSGSSALLLVDRERLGCVEKRRTACLRRQGRKASEEPSLW